VPDRQRAAIRSVLQEDNDVSDLWCAACIVAMNAPRLVRVRRERHAAYA